MAIHALLQVTSAVLALVRSLQQDATSPPAAEGGAGVGGQQELALHLQHLETLQHLVWERLNTGHWAKVVASPLGRNTHWVGEEKKVKWGKGMFCSCICLV